jgi:hypothetical protein
MIEVTPTSTLIDGVVVSVLDAGLRKHFAEVSVKVRECPDLSVAPFYLAAKGMYRMLCSVF